MMKPTRRHRRRSSSSLFAEELESRRLFDMVYPGDGPTPTEHTEEPASYVLGSKWSTTNLTYSFSNLFDGALPGGLSTAVRECVSHRANAHIVQLRPNGQGHRAALCRRRVTGGPARA